MDEVRRPARQAVDVLEVGEARQFEQQGRAVTFIPLVIRRRRVEKKLMPPEGVQAAAPQTNFDLPLLRTLGKAFYWQKLIDNGTYKDASQLARELKLDKGWVCEVLRMNRLAPDIVQAIHDGKQPRHLNLHSMRGRASDVPVDWQEQRQLFGFVSTDDNGAPEERLMVVRKQTLLSHTKGSLT